MTVSTKNNIRKSENFSLLGEFSHYINDAHVYVNHIDGLKEQLNREPLKLPELKINKKPFWDLTFEDFELKL